MKKIPRRIGAPDEKTWRSFKTAERFCRVASAKAHSTKTSARACRTTRSKAAARQSDSVSQQISVPQNRPDALQNMRSIPTDKFLEVWSKDPKVHFDAIVDGWIIPQQPAIIFRRVGRCTYRFWSAAMPMELQSSSPVQNGRRIS
jgi:hypothetical protein